MKLANECKHLEVQIVSDGNTVITGIPDSVNWLGSNEYNTGMVLVMEYDATFNGNGSTTYANAFTSTPSTSNFGVNGWKRKGVEICGEGYNCMFGTHVATNTDGTIIAASACAYNVNPDQYNTYVRIMKLHQYTQEDANNGTYYSGAPRQTSSGGKKMLFTHQTAAYSNSWNSPVVGEYYWVQMGHDIRGDSNNHEEFGSGLSMSDDGKVITFCVTDESDNATKYVFSYEYRLYTQEDEDNNTYTYNSRVQSATDKPLIMTWNTSTPPIVGEYYWTQIGTRLEFSISQAAHTAMSMTRDGRYMVFANEYDSNETGENNAGSLTMYETGVSLTETTTSEGPSIFISNVSISSNNATSPSLATSDGNNEITLTITALYGITQPTVTFQTGGVDISGNVTVSGSGKDYTASFTADRVDNLGDVTFSITNYEHNGTAGGEIINTTDGSKVKLVGKRFVKTTRASVANTQLGGDFIGIDNNNEYLGRGVAINGDGSIIAISSSGNDDVRSGGGKVDVFKYNYVDASWNLMGSSIRPDNFGLTKFVSQFIF